MGTPVEAGIEAYRRTVAVAADPIAEADAELARWGQTAPVDISGPYSVKLISEDKLNKIPVQQQPDVAGGVSQNTPNKATAPVEGPVAGAVVGMGRSGEALWNTLDAIDNFIASKTVGPDSKGLIEPSDLFQTLNMSQDPATQLGAAVGQYVLPFMAGGAAVNTLAKMRGLTEGAGFIEQALATGAINATIFSPQNENRLAKMIVDHYPELSNPLFAYLADYKNDSQIEGRFKNAVDGVIPDAMLAAVVKGLPATFKWFKQRMGPRTEIIPVDQVTANNQVRDIIAAKSSYVDGTPSISPDEVVALPEVKDSLNYESTGPMKNLEQSAADFVAASRVNTATLFGPQVRGKNDLLSKAQEIVDEVTTAVLREKTTGPQTMAEIDRAALEIIADNTAFARLIRGYKAGMELTTAQLRAVQVFTNNLFENVLRANDAFNKSGLATDLARRDQFLNQFVLAAQALIGGAEEAGRKLGVLAKSTEGVSDSVKFQAAMNRVKAMGGITQGQLTGAQINELKKVLGSTLGTRFFDAISKTGGNVTDAITYLAFNGMTSSPTTAARNLVQGSSVLGMKWLQDINMRVIGLVAGKDNAFAIASRMAEANLLGTWESMGEATRQALHTLETNEMFVPTLYQFEQGSSALTDIIEKMSTSEGAFTKMMSHAVNDAQKNYGVLTTRLNRTQDSFTGVLAYRRSIIRQSVLEAAEHGLTNAEAEKLIAIRLQSPPRGMHEAALKEAAETTAARSYQEMLPGFIGGTLQKADEALKTSKIGAVLVPFMKANANAAAQFWEHTPLVGLIAPRNLVAFKKGGPEAAEVIGKQLAGMQVMGLGYYTLHKLGYELTGDGPTDNATMKALRGVSPGYMPNAIKTPDGRYISLQNTGPVGELLMMMGQYQELSGMLKDDQKAALAFGVASHLAEHLTPDQLLRDMPSVFDALKGDTDIGQYLSHVATRFVPASGLIRFGRNLVDTNKREVRDVTSAWSTFVSEFKNLAPGYSRTLPPQRNIFGNVVAYPSGLGPDVASPFYTSEGPDTGLNKELRRLGVYNTKIIPMPEGASTMRIEMPERRLNFGVSEGISIPVELDNMAYDRYVIYSAGLMLPKDIDNPQALAEGGWNAEYSSILDDVGASPGKLIPLDQAITKTLIRLDSRTFKTELQRDEIKRLAVKSIIEAYRSIGRAAMFLEHKNEVITKAKARAGVLGGKRQ